MKHLAPFDEQEDISTKADHFWIVTFTIQGNLSVGSGANFRQAIPFDMELVSMTIWVGTSPASQSAIFELNKNNVAQITAAVLAGQNTGSTSASVGFSAGDYASIDVNQIGTGTVGANAVITLQFKYP